MGKVLFIVGNEGLLDYVKPLWEELNQHHKLKSSNFKSHHTNMTFQDRKEKFYNLLDKCELRVELAKDSEKDKFIGYCISSFEENIVGEIESIFVMKEYRGNGIGEKFMKNALNYMDKVNCVKRKIAVAEGNENAFGFYSKFGFYPRLTILEQK
ncbi:MAG: GNAT family N-acetyltransferase [Clostridiaceae bacterium]